MFGAAAMRGVFKALAQRRTAYGTAHLDLRKVQDPQQELGRLASGWQAGAERVLLLLAIQTSDSMQQLPMHAAGHVGGRRWQHHVT